MKIDVQLQTDISNHQMKMIYYQRTVLSKFLGLANVAFPLYLQTAGTMLHCYTLTQERTALRER